MIIGGGGGNVQYITKLKEKKKVLGLASEFLTRQK